MKLSHLFEHSIVDTPEFQRWFAGSKIVDAEGRPLRLYHGTSKDQDFRKFRIPGNGVWFSTKPNEASDYAIENDSQGFKMGDGWKMEPTHTASRVIPVYVRATNPLRLDGLPDELRLSGDYRAAQRNYFRRLLAQGYDAVVIADNIVVVLKDSNQIKSAIGNKNFNPAKPNMTEASIRFKRIDRR